MTGKEKKKVHGIKPCCKSLSRVYAYLDPDAVCYRATLSFMQRKLRTDGNRDVISTYISISTCAMSHYTMRRAQ
jgi:hypothetical protein